MDFKQELRKMALKQRPALPSYFNKEKVLEYARKFYSKITKPKADLLIRQAMNRSSQEVPWTIFAH